MFKFTADVVTPSIVLVHSDLRIKVCSEKEIKMVVDLAGLSRAKNVKRFEQPVPMLLYKKLPFYLYVLKRNHYL